MKSCHKESSEYTCWVESLLDPVNWMSIKETFRNTRETPIPYLKWKDSSEFISWIINSDTSWTEQPGNLRNSFEAREICSLSEGKVCWCYLQRCGYSGEMSISDTHRCVYGIRLFLIADLRRKVVTLKLSKKACKSFH